MKHQRNAYQQAVGQLMRRRREALNLTLVEASMATGGMYSPSRICAYENGWRNMRVEDLAALAAVYGVATRELMPADPDGYWWSM